MLAARRIIARLKFQAVAGWHELAAVVLTREDLEMLEGDTLGIAAGDLATFRRWHEAAGTDPEAALAEMEERVQRRALERLEAGAGRVDLQGV